MKSPHIAVIISLVAIGYFLMGMLGQLMAVPPGFATLFWPASGLALGACLIWGKRALPGVFLGSLGVNFYISASTAVTELPLALPTLIASGAVLQALIGAWLVKRFVGFPFAFHEPQKVVHFTLIGGPVSAVINATFSCMALLMLDVVSAEQFPINWLHWWLGDALGVVVTIPWLLALFPGLSRARVPNRRNLIFSLLCISAGMALFSLAIAKFEQKKQAEQFTKNSDLLAQSLQAEIDSVVDTLYGLSGFVLSNDQLTPEKFASYTTPILAREKGLHGLSWNQALPGERLDDFQQQMAVSYKNAGILFQVTQRNANGTLIAAEARAHHVVVSFIEPLSANRQALGYDVYSQAIRKEALDQAAELRQEVFTHPITLVQEKGNQAGVLVFLPVFTRSFSEPADQLLGFATAVLRVGSLSQQAFKQALMPNTSLMLIDPRAEPGQNVLYQIGDSFTTLDNPEILLEQSLFPLQRNNTIAIGAENWMLVQVSDNAFLYQPWGVHLLVVCGLIISALLNWFMVIVAGHAYETENQVKQRTRELSKLNRLFCDAQRIAAIGNWEWEIGNGQLWWSDEVYRIFGLDPKSFEPSFDAFLERVHPDDRAHVVEAVEQSLLNQQPYQLEYRVLLPNQSEKVVYVQGYVLFDEHKCATTMSGSVQDVTARKQVESELQRERQRLAEIIWSTHVGTWEWDIGSSAVQFNERWAEIVGYKLEHLQPTYLSTWSMLIHPQDLKRVEERLQATFNQSLDHYECEYRMRHRQGHWVWVLTRGKVIEWTEAGKPIRMSGTQTDITQRKLRETEIQRLALTDSLTGLANRSYFNKRLQETLKMAQRTPQSFALMLLDLDGFKGVNDQFGHPVGDGLLKHFAQDLSNACRETDVIARLGGDEFAVIVMSLEGEIGAHILAERILHKNKLPRLIDGHSIEIGVSIGIGVYPSAADDEKALIKVADEALYEAKKEGKNRFRIRPPVLQPEESV